MFAGMRTAHAYIDPSSMTYLIQIIAGAAIAIGAGVGFYWKRISRWLQKRREQSSTDTGANTDASECGPEDEVYDPTIVVNDNPEKPQDQSGS